MVQAIIEKPDGSIFDYICTSFQSLMNFVSDYFPDCIAVEAWKIREDEDNGDARIIGR